MNRISKLIGAVALAALPAVAQAQATSENRPVSFGVMGGASLPIGKFGDGSDMGFTLGAHILLSPSSLPMLGFRGDVTYDRWAAKGILGQAVDATTSNIGAMANVIVKSSSEMAIKPYVIGGLGLSSAKVSGRIGSIDASTDSDNNLAIQAGGGLEFKLSGFTTFIEAKYVNAFAENNVSWVPITFGIRF